MNTTPKKRGRKPRPYICPWNNETIDGLYHCPDGRWRNNQTGKKFTESDPRRAVARFRRSQARQQGSNVLITLPLAPEVTDPDLEGAIEFLLRHEMGPGHHHAPSDDTLILHVPTGLDPVRLLRAVPEDVYYAQVASDIITKPLYVAQRTGIEQIGYLTDLRKPTPSPTLQELGDYFFTRKKIEGNWMSKCRSFWAEFCEVVQVVTAREVEQEMVTAFKDAVEDRRTEGGFEPTYVRQRFEAVKSIINFPPKYRGKWSDDCNRLYGYCKVLVKPERNRPKPCPIPRDQFELLLSHSADDRLTAALLVSLNLCMYFGEAARVWWDDLDLDAAEMVGDREKLGNVIRIGVLWDRTVASLRKIRHRADGPVFINDAGNQMSYLDLKRLFDKARVAAQLANATPRIPQTSHLRDGAYTAAVRAKVGERTVKMLAGHETGISDQYALRDPTMVADACAAIDRRYFG